MYTYVLLWNIFERLTDLQKDYIDIFSQTHTHTVHKNNILALLTFSPHLSLPFLGEFDFFCDCSVPDRSERDPETVEFSRSHLSRRVLAPNVGRYLVTRYCNRILPGT